MSEWRELHSEVMDKLINYLFDNYIDSFILKGGTALAKCYGLDRFSEDIDLDGIQGSNPEDAVKAFCKHYGYTYRIAKDTETTKRYMINYGNESRPLKVETSYRRKEFRKEDVCRIGNILTYIMDILCIMKSNAYSSRDTTRDLFDISFICNNYFDQLSPQAKEALRAAVEYKGFDQFDYIMRNQNDELVDKIKLEDSFLMMYDKLGLLYDSNGNNDRWRVL